MSQSVMAGSPSDVDVFAPGHIGELTQILPAELIDAVLDETRSLQRRLRSLPSRVGVYFLLALGLFEHLGARLVWAKLTTGLAGRVPTPSEKALRDLRRRIGTAPLRRLFEVIAGPLGQPTTPGVRYRRWRTVAFDGCNSIAVPDHERNRAWLGSVSYRFGAQSYPSLQLMTLCETGTRGLLAACFGPRDQGESAVARRLSDRLTADMLVLADRAFDDGSLLADIAGRGAQFLVRSKANRRLPVLALLPDGTYLSRVADLSVRVIEAEITAAAADGSRIHGTYRLLTTLTDHHADPAARLIRLYHERWEIETTYLALRHTLLKGRVLRSKDPAGLAQEMWALLVVYQALRSAMTTAVETAKGCDPDRAAFTVALEAARDTVVCAITASSTPHGSHMVDLVGKIGSAVLDHLLPRRRSRISARIVKRGISRYHTWNHDGRPLKSVPLTAIDVSVHPPSLPSPPTIDPSDQQRLGRQQSIVKIMESAPTRTWKARDIAERLGTTDPKTIKVISTQLGTWARLGLLQRIARGAYKMLLHGDLPSSSAP